MLLSTGFSFILLTSTTCIRNRAAARYNTVIGFMSPGYPKKFRDPGICGCRRIWRPWVDACFSWVSTLTLINSYLDWRAVIYGSTISAFDSNGRPRAIWAIQWCNWVMPNPKFRFYCCTDPDNLFSLRGSLSPGKILFACNHTRSTRRIGFGTCCNDAFRAMLRWAWGNSLSPAAVPHLHRNTRDGHTTHLTLKTNDISNYSNRQDMQACIYRPLWFV